MRRSEEIRPYQGEEQTNDLARQELNDLSAPPSQTSEKSKLVEIDNEDLDQKKATTNIFMCLCNTINAILGSGEVGIPYAFAMAGPGLGAFLLAVMGLFSGFTMHIEILAGNIVGARTVPGLMHHAYGSKASIYTSLAVMLFPMLGMSSYKVIAGDTMSQLVLKAGADSLKNSILSNRQFLVFLFTMLITLPLSLYRYIGYLAKFSLVSFVLVISIGIFIVVRTFTLGLNIPKASNPWEFAHTGGNFVKSMNIMSFAYVCHHLCFQIYLSMKNPTMKRWDIVVGGSVVTSFTVMLIYGIAGYATFTTLTQGDILENYCYGDDIANIARVLLAVHVVLVYPLELMVVRESIDKMIFPGSQPSPLWRHVVITILIVIITVAISMSTNCLGIVQELAGAMGGTPMVFILPCLAYIKLKPEPFLSVGNILPIITICVGFAVSITGVALAILEMVQGVECTTGQQLPYCSVRSAFNNHTMFSNPNGTV